MKIFSFVRRGIDLEPIEVEVTLVPGLPIFQLIGLPDAAIRESLLRVRSAIRHQGYELPKRQQVIINLKPSFEKKSSQGLDLAMAVAYLLATEQIAPQGLGEEVYLYGELSLQGEVITPIDIDLLDEKSPGPVITGSTPDGLYVHHAELSHLNAWENLKWCEPRFAERKNPQQVSADFHHYRFSEKLAELLVLAASGEHSLFLAGPSGTGKTTFTDVLHSLLRPPRADQWIQIEKINRLLKTECAGRPLVSPHHSATEIALLGGGVPPRPGEITRAHHGLLVLDEYLEFDARVKESLREPIERHEITVSRAGGRVTFPADFLLVATTNLCPCGDFVPGFAATCDFSATHCKSYYRRMSGPMLDRFEVIAFSNDWRVGRKRGVTENGGVKWESMQARVQAAQNFALETRGQSRANGRLSALEIEKTIPTFVRQHLMPELPSSHRRRLALLRVARTIADLDQSPEIQGIHLERAKTLTLTPFQTMKEAWM